MPRNVEIKARVGDLVALQARAEVLSGEQGTLIRQEDTFYQCQHGRLKLRQLQGAPSELIYYARSDQECPKISNFYKVVIQDTEAMKAVLAASLGTRGIVQKERVLYMVGQTRVHTDRVDGLGDFMELEVMLADSQTPADGAAVARDLMTQLGIKDNDLVTCAYMDLLLQKETSS